MKRLKNISIRARITLMTAAICIIIAIAVTFTSLQIANEQFSTIAVSYRVDVLEDNSMIDFSDYEEDVYIFDDAVVDIVPVVVQAQNNFQIKIYLVLAVVIFLAVFAAWFLSGLMLKPVKQLEAAVSDISGKTLENRLAAPVVQDEIGSLTDSFNQMLDRLEADFERQKQFSSAVAHELKTPLATLQASLQLADMEEKIDPQLSDIAQRSTTRLTELVSGLLSLYQSTQVTERQVLSLNSVLQEAAHEVQAQFPEKHIALHLPEQEVLQTGSPILLHRLFYNLLENACKYSPDGEKINLTLTLNEHGYTVTVSDHGIGIPEQALPHIYEPFYRVDPSRNRDSGGLGLGLSIVKAIADSEGYEIKTESSKAGTCIYVHL